MDHHGTGFKIQEAALKISSMLSILERTLISRDTVLWSTPYRTNEYPYLELVISTWNPFLKIDIENFEKVQKRETQMPAALRSMKKYEQRLDGLNMKTLKTRPLRGRPYLKLLNKK